MAEKGNADLVVIEADRIGAANVPENADFLDRVDRFASALAASDILGHLPVAFGDTLERCFVLSRFGESYYHVQAGKGLERLVGQAMCARNLADTWARWPGFLALATEISERTMREGRPDQIVGRMRLACGLEFAFETVAAPLHAKGGILGFGRVSVRPVARADLHAWA